MATDTLQGRRAAAVTPSSTVDIPNPGDPSSPQLGCALFVGTTGNVQVEMISGDIVTFVNIPDGTFMPILVTKVIPSATTASNIIALW